jgi:uncharacterized Zn-finger protein
MTTTTIQPKPTTERAEAMPDTLPPRLRMYLQEIAGRAIPITYQALAKALQLLPPQTIQRLTDALERLMAEDAAAGRPFIAALVVARSRGGLPAPGFFNCAARLGRSHVRATGPEAFAFHAEELNAAVKFWGPNIRQAQPNVGRLREISPNRDKNPAKFRNDDGASEIRIGLKKFKCIGVSPPHDHPHIYLDMGDDSTILCPYCAALFRYDSRLSPGEAYPPNCLYSDNAAG